jgi:hypothetical protein
MAAYEYTMQTALLLLSMPWSNAAKTIQQNTEVTHVEDRNYVLLNENVKFKYHNT